MTQKLEILSKPVDAAMDVLSPFLHFGADNGNRVLIAVRDAIFAADEARRNKSPAAAKQYETWYSEPFHPLSASDLNLCFGAGWRLVTVVPLTKPDARKGSEPGLLYYFCKRT